MSKALKNKKLSKRQIKEMTQYTEHTEHTQILKLGKDVECKIRLQTTLAPGKGETTGVDVRKFMHNYPLQGGRQGILIAAEKWLSFVEKIIAFTVSVYGEEVFYSDEPQPVKKVEQLPETIAPNILQQVEKSIGTKLPINKKIEDTNFERLGTIGKQKKIIADDKKKWVADHL
jgi:hypothetical protein